MINKKNSENLTAELIQYLIGRECEEIAYGIFEMCKGEKDLLDYLRQQPEFDEMRRQANAHISKINDYAGYVDRDGIIREIYIGDESKTLQ